MVLQLGSQTIPTIQHGEMKQLLIIITFAIKFQFQLGTVARSNHGEYVEMAR